MRISDWSSDVCSSNLPPATRGAIAMAIRKHVSADLTLDDYVSADAFRGIRRAGDGQEAAVDRVRTLVDAGDIAAALREAVRGRLNILISGGTSRSEEHTSELQSLMRISYAVFCLKKK